MAVVWPSKNNFANGDVLTAANMNNIADTLNVFNPTSATNGQVWKADGAGSGAYGAIPSSFAQIAAGSMPTGTGTLSITSIPATYKGLVLLGIDVGMVSTSQPLLGFNTASTNFTWDAQDVSTTYGGTGRIGLTNVNSTTAHYFQIWIWNYFQTGVTTVYGFGRSATNNSVFITGRWNTTDVVTSLQVVSSANYNAGTYQLYGIG